MCSDNTRWFHLEPVDAWYFRDGRPSNRGEDQAGLKSQFPPNPPTVVGAIRAALARGNGWNGKSDWGDNIKKVLGDGFEDLGLLSFSGPFLTKNAVPVFPMPTHVLGEVVENTVGPPSFVPKDWLAPSTEPVTCDLGEVHLPLWHGKVTENESIPSSTEDFFVTSEGMERILNGELPLSEQCLHNSTLYTLEPRIGIRRDPITLTNEEGAIYSQSYVRLKENVALAVGVSGIPSTWSLPEYFPLGGESRMTSCKPIKSPEFPAMRLSGEKLLLLLVTPGSFPGEKWWGAGPGEDAGQLYRGFIGEIKTSAFGRPHKIGGWNSLERRPLDMRPFLKPGAVWWLENTNAEKLPQSAFLQIGEHKNYGYGLSFIGKQP